MWFSRLLFKIDCWLVSTEHPVYNLLCPSVCRSCYKKYIFFLDFPFFTSFFASLLWDVVILVYISLISSFLRYYSRKLSLLIFFPYTIWISLVTLFLSFTFCLLYSDVLSLFFCFHSFAFSLQIIKVLPPKCLLSRNTLPLNKGDMFYPVPSPVGEPYPTSPPPPGGEISAQ